MAGQDPRMCTAALIAIAWLGAGCASDPADSAAAKRPADTAAVGGADGGTPTPAASAPVWTVSLKPDGVEINIEGGPGGYWFGVTETTPGGWTGEDCVNGFTTADSEQSFYCHEAGDGGKRSFVRVAGLREMNGATTLFDVANEGTLTYYLYSDPVFGGSGECWVQGADTAYYQAEGCR